jgi:hypothetical protein
LRTRYNTAIDEFHIATFHDLDAASAHLAIDSATVRASVRVREPGTDARVRGPVVGRARLRRLNRDVRARRFAPVTARPEANRAPGDAPLSLRG